VATVTIKNTAYHPSKTTIEAGKKSVKWLWDNAPTQHDVVFSEAIRERRR
jgi:plastocyanin